MIPLVVRPKLLSLKNRWRNNLALRGQFGRDIVLATFSFLVVLSIYLGLNVALSKAKEGYHIAYISPTMILDIMFLFLFCLLLISNVVSALGLVLLGEDLTLFISSPQRKSRFFLGKLLEVA